MQYLNAVELLGESESMNSEPKAVLQLSTPAYSAATIRKLRNYQQENTPKSISIHMATFYYLRGIVKIIHRVIYAVSERGKRSKERKEKN